MTSLGPILFVALLVSAHACVRDAEPAIDEQAAPSERTLVGQVLLPSGVGSRGVEVLLTVTAADGEPRKVWLVFDEQGRFAHTLDGSLTGVKVTAGGRAEVYRLDTEELPQVDQAGQIDLGVIDLREQLTRHRMTLRTADGKPQGVVRVAMWFGPPHVGPYGEPVSLGSRQFPPVALGSEVEWLLSNEAHSIYFLVERPSGPGRGRAWRSGHQQLFGPFTSADIPAELILD